MQRARPDSFGLFSNFSNLLVKAAVQRMPAHHKEHRNSKRGDIREGRCGTAAPGDHVEEKPGEVHEKLTCVMRTETQMGRPGGGSA